MNRPSLAAEVVVDHPVVTTWRPWRSSPLPPSWPYVGEHLGRRLEEMLSRVAWAAASPHAGAALGLGLGDGAAVGHRSRGVLLTSRRRRARRRRGLRASRCCLPLKPRASRMCVGSTSRPGLPHSITRSSAALIGGRPRSSVSLLLAIRSVMRPWLQELLARDRGVVQQLLTRPSRRGTRAWAGGRSRGRGRPVRRRRTPCTEDDLLELHRRSRGRGSRS